MVKKIVAIDETGADYSLNDLLLRGRVSAEAIEKELPSGDFWRNVGGLASRWQVEAVAIARI